MSIQCRTLELLYITLVSVADLVHRSGFGIEFRRRKNCFRCKSKKEPRIDLGLTEIPNPETVTLKENPGKRVELTFPGQEPLRASLLVGARTRTRSPDAVVPSSRDPARIQNMGAIHGHLDGRALAGRASRTGEGAMAAPPPFPCAGRRRRRLHSLGREKRGGGKK